jgi:hypothetical protein
VIQGFAMLLLIRRQKCKPAASLLKESSVRPKIEESKVACSESQFNMTTDLRFALRQLLKLSSCTFLALITLATRDSFPTPTPGKIGFVHA